jgi:diguanylate cyclase
MTTLTNPFEIARETLRLLAGRRIPPTPDNYLTLYHEIAGTKAVPECNFPGSATSFAGGGAAQGIA